MAAMRHVSEDVINQGWDHYKEAGITLDRNMLAAKLIYKRYVLRLKLLSKKVFLLIFSRWKNWIILTDRPGKTGIWRQRNILVFLAALILRVRGGEEQDGVIKPRMGKYRCGAGP